MCCIKPLRYLLKRKQLTDIIIVLILICHCQVIVCKAVVEQRPQENRESFRPIGLWLWKWSFYEPCQILVHKIQLEKLGLKSGRQFKSWTRERTNKSIRPANCVISLNFQFTNVIVITI